MFKIGDKVRAFGNRGVVKTISKNEMFVEVKFDKVETTVIFNIDGRVFKWNKYPILKKIKENKNEL
jgi:hypothetical protein